MSKRKNVPALDKNEQIVILEVKNVSEEEIKCLAQFFENVMSIQHFCNDLNKISKLLPLMYMLIDESYFNIDKDEIIDLVCTLDHLTEVLEAA